MPNQTQHYMYSLFLDTCIIGSYLSSSGVFLKDITTSPTSSSSDLDAIGLTQCLLLMQLLFIIAISLLTILLCCFFFRHQSKESKGVTETLRIAEGIRRVSINYIEHCVAAVTANTGCKMYHRTGFIAHEKVLAGLLR